MSKDNLQPMVLWVSGVPKEGKSTFASYFVDQLETVFRTDEFVSKFAEWCHDDFLIEWFKKFGVGARGKFIDFVVEENKENVFVKPFLNSEHGFKPTGQLSVIEGYLNKRIQDCIVQELECRGYRVWIALTKKRLDFISVTGKNWR